MKKVDGVYVYVIKALGEDGKLHTFNVHSSMKVMKYQVQKKQVAITKAKAHSIAVTNTKVPGNLLRCRKKTEVFAADKPLHAVSRVTSILYFSSYSIYPFRNGTDAPVPFFCIKKQPGISARLLLLTS
ncbi:hypothetical protein [Bacillus halotolerans]|uniref:hypothetical protein n=1 Tax=Bacillus halotolerans TaxID=260554 RepID=UPI0021523286|nr:hypothetical protein [Bacillus halotolerans]